jgi:hypothetical protein
VRASRAHDHSPDGRNVDTAAMLATGSSVGIDVVVTAAVLLGPLLAIAIFWFGLRNARRHDEQSR